MSNVLIKRRKTRTSLELIQKWEIACECETRRTGDVAAEYGLPMSTVSTIKNSREKLKEMMEQAGLEKVEYFNLTLGVVALHRGFKF